MSAVKARALAARPVTPLSPLYSMRQQSVRSHARVAVTGMSPIYCRHAGIDGTRERFLPLEHE